MTLGEKLQLPRTPAFVVLPTHNTTTETLTAINGATEKEHLEGEEIKSGAVQGY